MDDLKQIIKARDSIRRKHLALKPGEQDFEHTVKKRLKPIINPLEKMAESFEKPLKTEPDVTSDLQNMKKIQLTAPNKKHSTLFDKKFYSVMSEDDFNDNNDFERKFITSSPALKTLPGTKKYLTMFDTSAKKNLDNHTGIRRMSIGEFKIGNKNVNFEENAINVGCIKYPATKGLLELLFKSNPEDALITPEDDKAFEEIVKNTNAYKKHYKPNASIREENTPKFAKYILKYIKSGKGLPTQMVATNAPIDYVHWNDPNELVDRLRLLTAEREAGNLNHDNEIMSIIEELREEKIIY